MLSKEKTKAIKMLKKVRGAQWTYKDELFCEDKSKSTDLKVDNKLSKDMRMELLALLVNSCRNSIRRTRNSTKPTYYGKAHAYKRHLEMASALISSQDFINLWVAQYLEYSMKKKRLEYRPTIGRIDHDKGYTLDNIKVEAYGKDTGQRTTERMSKANVAIVADIQKKQLVLFDCASVKKTLERINDVLGTNLRTNQLVGSVDIGLNCIYKNLEVFIISRKTLSEKPYLISLSCDCNHILLDVTVLLASLPDIPVRKWKEIRLHIDDIGIIHINNIGHTDNVEVVEKQGVMK